MLLNKDEDLTFKKFLDDNNQHLLKVRTSTFIKSQDKNYIKSQGKNYIIKKSIK